jgi:hypothetical protein
MASTGAFSSLAINSMGGASGDVSINSCCAGKPVAIKRLSPCALKKVLSEKNGCAKRRSVCRSPRRRFSPKRCSPKPKRCSPKRFSPKRCSPKKGDCVERGIKNFVRSQKSRSPARKMCYSTQPQAVFATPQQAKATTSQVVSAAIQAALPSRN